MHSQDIDRKLFSHCFHTKGNMTLPFDPTTNRGHLQAMRIFKPSLKFLDPGISSWMEMVWTLNVIVIFNTNLVTLKPIEIIYLSWPIYTPSLKIIDPSILRLLIGNRLDFQCYYDLDLLPSAPKSTGFIYWSCPVYIHQIIGPCILKLLIRNGLVHWPTDGLTYRPTDTSKGDIIITYWKQHTGNTDNIGNNILELITHKRSYNKSYSPFLIQYIIYNLD